ncbi:MULTISPECIES: phosphopantetheine-binding protein [Peptoniphilaceae]|jgi:acyl carrier protein 1|uniref:acyl carrier protein n=1 Tax=Peptoniphilaceae TaxID=1570339 RepID=UPI002911F1BE|nr:MULTISPECIES: phosphopantetheine-binding protein [Peptoniphilus]MDU5377679.1 phosphopantetheine-binding protein [Peptoniphilus lacydonensis]MDU5437351.1 phosphopantetheine-binding protein [Peptoniphilus lacydonensis]MDU5595562.1 phosphopantetheine-binding protein [Peptoniphilus rhinitidis]MDU7303237.1 phosphopantetheine-binding protein [Peptoniphilus lacydonensis]
MSKVDEIILKQISTILNVDKDRIKDDSRLVEDLGANSFELAEIFLSLEDELNIDLKDKFILERTVYIKTIRDLVDEALSQNEKWYEKE